MHRALAVSMFSSVGLIGFACTNDVGEPLPVGVEQPGATGAGGAASAANGVTAQTSGGGTVQSSGTANATSGDGTTATSATSAGSPSSSSVTNAAATTDASTASSGSPTTTSGSGSGGTGQQQECTDVPPDDRETCATWAEWGECENPDGWLDDYCDASCGRCNGTATTAGSGGAGSSTDANTSTDASTNTDAGSSTTGGDLGNDNPYSPIQGGTNGFATRYWDCCKPSCGWSGNANPTVVSCDVNDQNRSANENQNSCEANGQSGAFTCHSMAPWAHSNVVSYGFAAVNGVGCGTCFQVEFPGTSQRGGNDQGSAALAGKTMIIMATNIGGIEQNQFDILIPGGGVGLLNGCSGQWGIDNGELGAQYGGFLSVCREGNWEDHEAAKNCVRQKCESVFGSRGLTELYDGCMWFVDWFEAADNPDIRFQQIQCPSELTSVAY